jgi:hypothetical protein
MSSQLSAKSARIARVDGRRFLSALAVGAALFAAAIALAACMPETTQFARADPADPAARVAGVGYRSTIAPYTSLRPATPAPWRERNDAVTPQRQPDH